MKRIMKLENLFAIALLISFLLPWSNRLQGISDTVLTGVQYTLSMLFLLSPLLGLAIAMIPLLCIVILIQSIGNKNTLKLRTAASVWTILLFLLAIGYHIISGVNQGKSFADSLAYQFSLMSYGVYAALLSAIGIYFAGRRTQ